MSPSYGERQEFLASIILELCNLFNFWLGHNFNDIKIFQCNHDQLQQAEEGEVEGSREREDVSCLTTLVPHLQYADISKYFSPPLHLTDLQINHLYYRQFCCIFLT